MRTEQRSSIAFAVNGKEHRFYVGEGPGDVAPSETLAHTLRERLELTGTKISCDKGACGACTVIIDGEAVLSCLMLSVECDGVSILTVEGLENPETGVLDPLQQAFMDKAAFQCGYCSPGVLMAVKALLGKTPTPTEEELAEALSGNYCRCGSHHQVIETVMEFTGRKVS